MIWLAIPAIAAAAYYCLVMIAAALLGFWSNLWAVPLFDLDEGAFSQATRELLDSGTLPLGVGERAQLARDVVPGLDESLEHHREIGVGDAPRAEQRAGSVGDDGFGEREELFDGS